MKILKIFIFGLMVILISKFAYSQYITGVYLDPSSSLDCPGTIAVSYVYVYIWIPSPDKAISPSDIIPSCSPPFAYGIGCAMGGWGCDVTSYNFETCILKLFAFSSSTTPPGSYQITVTVSIPGSSASATYTYTVSTNVSISSVQLNPSMSSSVCPGTQTLSTVTAYLNNPCV